MKQFFVHLLARNYGLQVKEEDIFFSSKFQRLLQEKKFDSASWFDVEPFLLDDEGNPDYWGTCFYMINSLQEYADTPLDKFGRFRYEDSYQSHFSCVEENLVEKYLRLALVKTKLPIQKSRFLVTHDVDLINSGLKQEFHFLKNKKGIINAFLFVLSHFLQKRTWSNIDKIMKMETEYDLKSTFFWIANNEKDKANNIRNGDYKIKEKKVQESLDWIEKKENFEIGIHKSSNSTSINEELKILNRNVIANRYHYLKFHPKNDYEKLSKSRIKVDCSLGFAEKMGFRNSYGLPFRPYDMVNGKLYDFLEVPLQIMDTTFMTYRRGVFSKQKIEKNIFDFLESNNENSLISILWHNEKMTELSFSDLLHIFKSIMQYIYETKSTTLTVSEVYDEYC
ncbi:MAG: DUF7033 domain-containing protein [Chitinophagales bacterium]